MYERRIEHSLYRTMAELRKLRKEGKGEGVRGAEVSDLTAYTELLSRATPGIAMDLPQAEGQIGGTKPICPDENGEEVGRGRPTLDQVEGGLCEETPGGVTTNVPETEGPTRGTKPISAGNSEERVPDAGTTEEVGRGRPTLDQVEGRLYEETPDGVTTNVAETEGPARGTKPISEEVSSLKCEVASEQDQAASPPASNLTLPTSHFPVETAAQPPDETKPIGERRIKDNEGYRPYYRRRR